MKKIFLIIALLLSYNSFSDSVALNLENDCLLRKGRDEDFTHGTEIQYNYNDLWQFKIQQNMYTPNDIKRYDHIVDDRPYCGWLGMEVGREMFKDNESPWSHYLGLNFGMIGPSSKAGETQKLIHKWLDCRKPNGWDNQLADEFCVNAQWWTKYNWFICDYVALIPRAGLLVGTIQDAAEVGCDLKVGWNVRKDVGHNITFSAAQFKNGSFWDNFQFYVYSGPDCRYYLYNHILEGSLFNSNDDGLGVDIKPFVGEIQLGTGIEIYGFFVKWYGVFRTKEYKTQERKPDYGGLNIGYRFDF